MITTAKKETVIKAIEIVNNKYGYELIFNQYGYVGKRFNFTIRSRFSGIAGSRYGYSGRKLVSASWHAHGYLMETIFDIDPTAIIYSLGKRIERGFTWEDKNIGSIMNPVYFSTLSIL